MLTVRVPNFVEWAAASPTVPAVFVRWWLGLSLSLITFFLWLISACALFDGGWVLLGLIDVSLGVAVAPALLIAVASRSY